ncbi:unnamed protein product, partial [Porites evermanni]
FIRRKDVFCVLPTGCGKSLIFQLVPLVCAYLHNEKFNYPEKPILLVICPLSALVESHIQELANYGIFPELTVREERWRKLLQSQEFQDNLFGLVTDEAHVVPKW